MKGTVSILTTPLGEMYLAKINHSICALQFADSFANMAEFEKKYLNRKEISEIFHTPSDKDLQAHLDNYFQQKREIKLSEKLECSGTEFQNKIWEYVSSIPFGRTTEYGKIANDLNARLAVRAIGAAIGANPILILIPCHRVLASNGKLQGYRGGVQRKAQLLALENAQLL